MIAIRTSSTCARLSRRAFLRATGASAALLPLLHAEGAVGAGGVARRVITVAWTNGMPSTAFWPADDRPTSSEVLAPLAPVASKVLGPLGLDLRVMLDNGRKYDGHRAFSALFTASHAYVNGQNVSTGPSIDQVVARAVARQVNLPIPVLNFTTAVGAAVYVSTSADDKGVRSTPETSPTRLFGNLFGSAGRSPAQVTAVLQRRSSVLDYLTQELGAFGARFGAEDRAKIDAHLEAVRALEQQLSASAGRSCTASPAPALGGDLPAQTRAFLDLTAIALRCDLTRAVSLTLSADYGNPPNSFPFLGINANYHSIAHQGPAGYASKTKIDAWFYGQVAYLAKALDDTPETGGTALDNTVIVVGNDMNEGSNHHVGRIPFVLIGGGGYFKTGRALKLGAWAGKTGQYWLADVGVPHNKLLASVCNAVGVPVDGLGQNYPGTLPELRS